jgi:hypothetical protein
VRAGRTKLAERSAGISVCGIGIGHTHGRAIVTTAGIKR